MKQINFGKLKSIRERSSEFKNQPIKFVKIKTKKISYKKNYKALKNNFREKESYLSKKELNKIKRKIIYIYYKKGIEGVDNIPKKFLKPLRDNFENLKNNIKKEICNENIQIENTFQPCNSLILRINYLEADYCITIWLSNVSNWAWISYVKFENKDNRQRIWVKYCDLPLNIKKIADKIISFIHKINYIILDPEIVDIRVPGAKREYYSLNDYNPSIMELLFHELGIYYEVQNKSYVEINELPSIKINFNLTKI